MSRSEGMHARIRASPSEENLIGIDDVCVGDDADTVGHLDGWGGVAIGH